MAMHLVKFVVRGSGEFPLDMLRYDSCWPARGDDVAMIRPIYETAQSREEMAVREVTLCKYIERKTSLTTTPARWQSYGWAVISEEVQ